jgi:hypothetical protein
MTTARDRSRKPGGLVLTPLAIIAIACVIGCWLSNLLVLTATKATLDAAPHVRRNQVDQGDEFAAHSQKVDQYWSGYIPVAKN